MTNGERVTYFYETVVSQNLLEELPAYISGDCIWSMGGETAPCGLEGMRRHLSEVRRTYPVYRIKIIGQWGAGRQAIPEFVMEGTLRGEWLGLRPTRERMTFTGVNIDEVVDGKITAHGGAVNTFETLWEHRLIGPV